MRAAILREYGEPLDIHEVPDPEPGPDGAVVRVTACGVCRSDWHAWAGHGEWADDRVPRGQVLGHEPAGEVVTVGDSVDRFAPGDRVVVPFSLGDGTCPRCRQGHGTSVTTGERSASSPRRPARSPSASPSRTPTTTSSSARRGSTRPPRPRSAAGT